VRALGISAPIYLGGAGAGATRACRTPATASPRFIDADEREAVGALVAIIREQRPHVVVTYDPMGGYGHPTTSRPTPSRPRRVEALKTADYPGEPWTVPKLTGRSARSAFKTAYDALDGDDLWREWKNAAVGRLPFDIPTRTSTRSSRWARKRAAKAALAAHATQVIVGPTGRVCALSNNLAMPILGHEHYVLAVGSAGDRDERGW
jgi:N-acetyl-1-D-myo-inositol-2-amino-2-deoxy-alpha-D-glucopyranoside deacetylase